MALPNTTQERIKADAERYIDQIHCHVGDMEYEAYIAGATAEAERAQKMVDYVNLVYQKANEGIEYWNKQIESNRYNNAINDQAYEALRMHETERDFCKRLMDSFPDIFSDRPCPHCGKELNRDRNLCCECGKEVEIVKEIEYMPIQPVDAKKFDCPKRFPMHLLNEDQAQRNHSQSLKRLKERGGLSVHEILAVAGKKPYSYYGGLPWNEALKMLNEIVLTNPTK
jgi:endogenous inhibitor of DNA gyrase (YacG/DUF329 family)